MGCGDRREDRSGLGREVKGKFWARVSGLATGNGSMGGWFWDGLRDGLDNTSGIGLSDRRSRRG